MIRLCIALIAAAVAGCAGIQSQRYAYNSSELTDANSGVVVGAETSGAGISFLNLVTREEIDYHGASVFCLRLPEGSYSLYGIGERSGPMGSESPFTFEVKRGERKYIGTIVKPWRTSAIDRRSIVSVREYRYDRRLFASGGSPNVLFGPSYELVVINRPADVMGKYEKDCPGLKAQEIKLAPMR